MKKHTFLTELHNSQVLLTRYPFPRGKLTRILRALIDNPANDRTAKASRKTDKRNRKQNPRTNGNHKILKKASAHYTAGKPAVRAHRSFFIIFFSAGVFVFSCGFVWLVVWI